jgi:plastocyanin
MKFYLSFAVAFALSGFSTSGGTIVGTVRAQGKAGADSAAAGGNYDSRQFKFVERVDYDAMRDFVVFIDGPVAGIPSSVTNSTKTVVTKRVKQIGATFDPHVLPVMAGTTVEWPNNDQILHNVFSYSEAKQFDLGLYKAPQIEKVTFDKAGRVDVFCSIHSRMNCVVLVLENPFFAATNEKGKYAIKDVPAGTYKLKAWHERLPPDVREINVPKTGEVHADFVLGIKNLPKN